MAPSWRVSPSALSEAIGVRSSWDRLATKSRRTVSSLRSFREVLDQQKTTTILLKWSGNDAQELSLGPDFHQSGLLFPLFQASLQQGIYLVVTHRLNEMTSNSTFSRDLEHLPGSLVGHGDAAFTVDDEDGVTHALQNDGYPVALRRNERHRFLQLGSHPVEGPGQVTHLVPGMALLSPD